MSGHYRSVKEKVEKGQNRNRNFNNRQCTWKFLRTEIKCYLIKLSSTYHSDNLFLEISENLLNTGSYVNFTGFLQSNLILKFLIVCNIVVRNFVKTSNNRK